MRDTREFDELKFFADVKKRPGMYFGQPSLLSLRDVLTGMEYAFYFYTNDTNESLLRYFRSFRTWYQNEKIGDQNGYASWWNHLLYISGNDDRYAFERFFAVFERYLQDVHGVSLPPA